MQLQGLVDLVLPAPALLQGPLRQYGCAPLDCLPSETAEEGFSISAVLAVNEVLQLLPLTCFTSSAAAPCADPCSTA